MKYDFPLGSLIKDLKTQFKTVQQLSTGKHGLPLLVMVGHNSRNYIFLLPTIKKLGKWHFDEYAEEWYKLWNKDGIVRKAKSDDDITKAIMSDQRADAMVARGY